MLSRHNKLEDAPEGIGIGVPGHLSADRRVPIYTNLHQLDSFPLASFLEQRLKGCAYGRVLLDNDATVAAWAECLYGAGRGIDRLFLVTLGSGIGAGLILHGEPQRPVRGTLGDPGHIIVAPSSARRCSYGCRGCLEAVAASSAIENEALEAARANPASLLARAWRDEDTLTVAAIVAAARAGDAAALAVLGDAGRWLGMGLVSWCYVYDPEVILLGGGVSAAGELLLEPIRKTVAEVGAPVYMAGLRVGLAQLGNDAGIIGAASLFWPPEKGSSGGESLP